MATLAKLSVELDLLDRMSQGLDKTRKNLSSWGADLRRIGMMATAGLTVPVAGGFAKLIMAASDLNEATSATETIFADSAKGIIKWSRGTADAYGISQREGLEAVNVLGQLYKGVGFTGDAAATMGRQMVEAAGDLASFYNAAPTDVLRDIQSGLVGQYEPLLKYGIVLNETTVQQKAMAMTGKTMADQLTDQEKIAARQALITEGLGDAQGDAARTANSLANMIRRLRARGADLAAQWGQKLLPFALKFLDRLIKLTDRFERLSPRVQTFAFVLAAVAAAIGPVLIALGLMLPAIAALLGPIGLVVAAVGVLGAAFATNFLGIRDAVGNVVEEVVYFGKAMIEAFNSGKGVQKLVEYFPGPLQGVAKGFLLIADAIGDVVAAYRSGGFKAMLSAIPEEINQLLQGLGSIVGTVVTIAIDTAVSIAGWLWDHKDDIWGGIKALVGWTTDTFSDAITAVVDGALELGPRLKAIAADFGGWLWRTLKGAWKGTVQAGTLAIDTTIVVYEQSKKSDSFARSLWNGLVDAVKGTTAYTADLARAIVDQITTVNWMGIVTADAFNVGAAFGAALESAVSRAYEIQDGIANGLIEVLKDADWSKIVPAIVQGIDLVLRAPGMIATGLAAALVAFVGGAIAGFVFGPETDFNSVVTKIKNGIQGAVDTAGEWTDMLVSKGAELITGLLDGLVTKWLDVDAWFNGRDTASVGAIGGLLPTLKQKGVDLVTGLMVGLVEKWQSVHMWLVDRKNQAVSAVGNLVSTLLQKGKDLITGFYAGAVDKWTIGGVASWLKGRGAAVLAAIGDLSGLLYGVGISIVQGMANGLYAGAGKITDAASYLVSLIPDSVKKLLGIASPSKVMAELFYAVPQGMAKGMLAGRPMVAGAAGELAGAAVVGASASVAFGAMAGAMAGGGSTHTYGNIYITVDGAGDPDAVADRVFAKFSREMALYGGGA